MENVYLVYEQHYDEFTPLGVYDSLELAIDMLNQYVYKQFSTQKDELIADYAKRYGENARQNAISASAELLSANHIIDVVKAESLDVWRVGLHRVQPMVSLFNPPYWITVIPINQPVQPVTQW